MSTQRLFFKFCAVVAGLPILLFLVMMLMTSGQWSPERARLKQCQMTMRELQAALKEYNQSHSPQIDSIDASGVARLFPHGSMPLAMMCPGTIQERFPDTFSQKLLTRVARFAGTMEIAYLPVPGGTYSGASLTASGQIRCSLHGPLEE